MVNLLKTELRLEGRLTQLLFTCLTIIWDTFIPLLKLSIILCSDSTPLTSPSLRFYLPITVYSNPLTSPSLRLLATMNFWVLLAASFGIAAASKCQSQCVKDWNKCTGSTTECHDQIANCIRVSGSSHLLRIITNFVNSF